MKNKTILYKPKSYKNKDDRDFKLILNKLDYIISLINTKMGNGRY